MKYQRASTVTILLAAVLLISLLVTGQGPLTVEATIDHSLSPNPLKPAVQSAINDADSVVIVEEPSLTEALTRLENGELDIYVQAVNDAAIAQQIGASPNLEGYLSFGNYDDLTFNPSGPIFAGTGKLNPFAVPRIREAMNRLVDRHHIAQEIYGGLAAPRWHALNTVSSDYAQLADVAHGLELTYAYDKQAAQQIVAQEMVALGATFQNGLWHYAGEPVEIILLIRIEDKRLEIGDYVADQLEEIGFVVIRQYGTSGDLGSIWAGSDPADGLFHIYTGGWIAVQLARDLSGNFAYFYTDMGYPVPLWQAYVNTPEFYDLAARLNSKDFATLAERHTMMAQALEWALADSNRIFLVDRINITPRRTEVSYASDLFGGITGSWLWPYTLQREGNPTTPLTIGSPSILNDPWNPLNGSPWPYDIMLIRATSDAGTLPDPYTGLAWPQRIDHAEVIAQAGLPIFKSLDWVDLQFVPTITVPGDAWVDWDAAEQRFLTAAEVYAEPQTALRKSIVHYPTDLYDTVTWHDGSPFSIADVVLHMILTFDRAKEASAVYDPSQVAAFNWFMSTFKGVRILSADPLIIEHYSDSYQFDAELSVDTWWPHYAHGPGAWHTLALGLLAEADGEAAFSQYKAYWNNIPWLNYIAGPSLTRLADQLNVAQPADYIPYAPTLDAFITTAQAAERWDNLANWYGTYDHFWVGLGPLYLAQVHLDLDWLLLKPHPTYPDAPDKWDDFLEPAIAELVVDGPDSIERGEEAVYIIEILLNGQPYPNDDIEAVRYLVLDSQNRVRLSGDAEPMTATNSSLFTFNNTTTDGLWRVVFDADMTQQLPPGANRLEIAVISKRVVIPSFASQPFTAPNLELFLPVVLR